METDFPASGNRFFVQRFSLLEDTVTETSGRELYKKEHILTNVSYFLTSGTHFLSSLRQQSKHFILQQEHIFQLILHSG